MPADKMIPRLCSNFISSRSKNCFEVWPSEWPGQTGHSIGCSRLDAALNERGIPTELLGDQHRADNDHRHVEDQHEPGRIAGRTHEMFAEATVYVGDGVVGCFGNQQPRQRDGETPPVAQSAMAANAMTAPAR